MNVDKPFVSFLECAVAYEGRASSTLGVGNYLVVYKPDKSIAIHGASFANKPLNYQNAGAVLRLLKAGSEFEDVWANSFDGNELTKRPMFILLATNKKEILKIGIYATYWWRIMSNWTDSKIDLTKSERDLVNKIYSNITSYFPNIEIVDVNKEVRTPYGNIDLLIIDICEIHHIVEVKRRMATISGCGQVARYAKYFKRKGIKTREYLAAPSISKNAIEYCAKHGQLWVEASFDD